MFIPKNKSILTILLLFGTFLPVSLVAYAGKSELLLKPQKNQNFIALQYKDRIRMVIYPIRYPNVIADCI